LLYAMPWHDSEEAILDYLEWGNAQSKMTSLELAPKQHRFSYAKPSTRGEIK